MNQPISSQNKLNIYSKLGKVYNSQFYWKWANTKYLIGYLLYS